MSGTFEAEWKVCFPEFVHQLFSLVCWGHYQLYNSNYSIFIGVMPWYWALCINHHHEFEQNHTEILCLLRCSWFIAKKCLLKTCSSSWCLGLMKLLTFFLISPTSCCFQSLLNSPDNCSGSMFDKLMVSWSWSWQHTKASRVKRRVTSNFMFWIVKFK